MTESTAQDAYAIFRGGFRKDAEAPPHWDDLNPWIRDAIKVAYLQGSLDAKWQSETVAETER